MSKGRKKKDKVFNDRGRKVFRNYIGPYEVGFSAFFVGFVALMAWWFAAQKEKYDPGERDISIEVLIAQSVEDRLYKTPLKRWVDPASVVAGAAAGPDLGLFPESILGDGWTESSRLQEFDDSTLYEKIDGQEVQYKSYGFERLHFIGIANDAEDLEISIELYDMGTFTNALGIFAAQRNPGAMVDEYGAARYYLTEAGAIGLVGHFYYKLTGNASSERIQEQSVKFIEVFEPTVQASESLPQAYVMLAQIAPFENIGYVKQDVFQYEFANDFWFARPDGVEGDVRVFVHMADSADAAERLFGLILEEHSFEYDTVSLDDGAAVLKHKFLDSFFTMKVQNEILYGVESAETEDEAAALTSSLETSLAGGDGPVAESYEDYEA